MEYNTKRIKKKTIVRTYVKPTSDYWRLKSSQKARYKHEDSTGKNT